MKEKKEGEKYKSSEKYKSGGKKIYRDDFLFILATVATAKKGN